ncbi:MAG TPA: amidohydrolase family protein [Polyangia bacterium]|nr:amidohydrolase family protein [Polyangia bacterium]
MIYAADLVYADGRLYEDAGVAVDDGRITGLSERPSGPGVVRLSGRALVPGTVNAHNHSFQSLLRGFGDDLSFLEWRERALYRYSPRLGVDGVYTGALLAFGEMLLHGVTTVCDFFYLNDGGNDNARAVVRAARDLGIRLVLARCFYDWEGAPAAYSETPADAQKRFLELREELRGDTQVSVQPAPHSLHGASEAMIRAGAEVAAESGLPLHIHVAEERYQVDDALKRYGARPLFALDRMGALGARTVCVHGCWFDESERALLAERGGALAYNPNSNMFLGDGVTDIVDLFRRGVRIALGTDGGCSNSRVSVFDEMRACALLQKVTRLDGRAIDAETCFGFGTRGGGEVLELPVGRIAPGYAADLVALDLEDLSLLPLQSFCKNVVYALSARAIADVIVAGRRVVADRELCLLPVGAIRERVRQLTRDWTR